MTAARLGGGAALTGAALLIAAAAALRPEIVPVGGWEAAQPAAASGLAWHRVPPQCRRSYRLVHKGEVWAPGLVVACLRDGARSAEDRR